MAGQSKTVKPKPPPRASSKASGNEARQLKKKIDKLEGKVQTLEAELSAVQIELADPQVYADADKMHDLIEKNETLERRVQRAMTEWELALEKLE